VDVAEQRADGGGTVTERHLARRGDLEAHLVLDVRHVCAVALAELTRLEVDVELRDDEQAEALRAGAGALRAGEDEVDDVVDHVRLGRGDEALDARDVPRAVVVLRGLGAAGAHVRTGVGLGQHHRAVPAAVDDVLRELLLLLGAHEVQQRRERVARGEHVDGRVGAADEFGERPAHGRRHLHAVELDGGVEHAPAGVDVRLVRLLERLRHRDRLGLRVVDRGVAVGVDEARREVTLGELRDLADDVLRDVDVDVLVDAGAQHVLTVEDLEEVELKVANVALVVRQDVLRDR